MDVVAQKLRIELVAKVMEGGTAFLSALDRRQRFEMTQRGNKAPQVRARGYDSVARCAGSALRGVSCQSFEVEPTEGAAD